MQAETAFWKCLEGVCVESKDGSGMYNSFNECVMLCENTSINDLSNNIEVYPNPSTGLFKIHFKIQEKIDLSVYSMLVEVGVNHSIELSNYSKRIYNQIIKNGQCYHGHKLLVQ